MAIEPGKGHNSVAADQGRLFIGRVERLAEGRTGINAAIRDVLAEAKATGYDTKTIRAVIKIRAMDKAAREEQEALLDTYLSALGLL